MSTTNILTYGFIFFLIFPYLQIYNFGTDSQPYGLILSIIISLAIKPKTNKIIASYLVLFLFSLLVFFIDTSNTSNAARSIANYASLFFISYSLCYLIPTRISLDKLETIIRLSLIIWIATGILQKVIDINIFDFIVPVRTTDTRGVTGLAPEPTFYGMVLIFHGAILFLLNKKFLNRYTLLCAGGVVFLAQSSMALLYLILGLTLYVTLKKNTYFIPTLLTILFAVFFLNIINLSEYTDTRLGYIMYYLSEDPMYIVTMDASIGDRLSHVFFSFKGFLDNFGMPHGYNSVTNYFTSSANNITNLNLESLSAKGRIMSGYGAAFFELGFIALVLPLVTIYIFMRSHKKNSYLTFHLIFISLIMISAIPMANTFFILYNTLVIIKSGIRK